MVPDFIRQIVNKEKPGSPRVLPLPDARTSTVSSSSSEGSHESEALAIHNSPINNPKYSYLTFRRGDRLRVITETNENWWHVYNTRSKEDGYVPTSYVSRLCAIKNEPWFHNELQREASVRTLIRAVELSKGAFLVRPSSIEGGFALDVKMSPVAVKNFRIESNGKSFYIELEHPFPSVQELIRYYQQHKAKVLNARLTNWVPRKSPPVQATRFDFWEIDRQEITIKKILGKGNFGTVWLGMYSKLPVAIKELTEKSGLNDQELKFEFDKEAKMLKSVDHENIVQLYGVSTTMTPFYIVTEYMSGGSLLEFMKGKTNASTPPPISPQQSIDILIQVASGMSYLELNSIIHRDLAARNILVETEVNGRLIVKLSDFGLTRRLENELYYINNKFPIRWSPPEVLIHAKFNDRSDVWSFGVVIFELYTRGEVPYKELGSALMPPNLYNYLNSGKRLRKPSRCPQIVHDKITSKCFEFQHANRPEFRVLLKILKEIPFAEIESYGDPLQPRSPLQQKIR